MKFGNTLTDQPCVNKLQLVPVTYVGIPIIPHPKVYGLFTIALLRLLQLYGLFTDIAPRLHPRTISQDPTHYTRHPAPVPCLDGAIIKTTAPRGPAGRLRVQPSIVNVRYSH